MLIIERYKVGPLETNCYFITDNDTKKSAIIDPGGISSELDEKIESIGKENIEYILMTHGHFDHIRKAVRYQKMTGAKLMIGKDESQFTKDRRLNLCRIPMPAFDVDVLLNDGDIIKLGEIKIKVLNTPGHTVGGVCFIVDNCMFVGDTIMKGTVGRCDLNTGSLDQMMSSILKISKLQGNYNIYPGHGDMTTLDDEKKNNVYFRKVQR